MAIKYVCVSIHIQHVVCYSFVYTIFSDTLPMPSMLCWFIFSMCLRKLKSRYSLILIGHFGSFCSETPGCVPYQKYKSAGGYALSVSLSLSLLRSWAGKFAEDKKPKAFSGILTIHVATDVFTVQRGVNLWSYYTDSLGDKEQTPFEWQLTPQFSTRCYFDCWGGFHRWNRGHTSSYHWLSAGYQAYYSSKRWMIYFCWLNVYTKNTQFAWEYPRLVLHTYTTICY